MTTPNTAEGTGAAIEKGHAAYLSSRETEPGTRAIWLEAVASALEGAGAELVNVAAAQTHLAEGRLQGELARTVFQLRLFAAELRAGEPLDATIDHEDAAWGMGPRPDIRRLNVPLGVVGVFGASNFPFAFSVAGGDTASALAAGCAVVHKIHDAHLELGKRTAEVVIDALASTGAPQGLFAAIQGREAANALVDHPLVKAIGFTGSTAGGRALFDRASQRPEPIPFYGELGSINPVFVTPAAWAERSAQIIREYAVSFTMGMGQFCTKPGLFFAPIDGVEEAHLVRQELGVHLQDVLLGPLLSSRLHEGFAAAVSELSADDDVSVLVHGAFGDVPQPTVLFTTAEAVRRKPELMQREMFGPATLIIGYSSADELVLLAQLLEGQLTTTVHAADEDMTDLTMILAARSGRVIWNGWPTGVTVSYAQQHGGPYPATTAAGTTSVGTAAVRRFMRPVAYQSFPGAQLPPALRDDNPWRIRRRVDGRWEEAPRP